jgi:type IV pilus assembly protein PilV
MTSRDHLRKNVPASKGFTLIEVLVAMLILAIGILGIAALQYKGMQYNQDAYFRTQVNYLAYDMADRIRLNKNNVATYASSVTSYSIPTTRPTSCTQTGTGATGAANDIACWKQELYDALPPGSTADITDNGGGIYTIALAWTDREGNTHNVQYSFEL